MGARKSAAALFRPTETPICTAAERGNARVGLTSKRQATIARDDEQRGVARRALPRGPSIRGRAASHPARRFNGVIANDGSEATLVLLVALTDVAFAPVSGHSREVARSRGHIATPCSRGAHSTGIARRS